MGMTETPAEQRLREVAIEGWPELSVAQREAIDLGREALALLAAFDDESDGVDTSGLGAWRRRVAALIARARSGA